jgi:hypothetical protein
MFQEYNLKSAKKKQTKTKQENLGTNSFETNNKYPL